MTVLTFFAVIVALFGEKFWAWFNRPRIKAEFNKKSERCFRSAIVLVDNIQDYGSFSNVKRQYFRLRIANNGRSVARNLKVKIELYDSENNLADRFEPSALNWITGTETINLAPEEDCYLNLISQVIEDTRSIGYQLRIELANMTLRGIAWDRHLYNWKLKLFIYGENINKPVIKTFDFIPNGEQIGELKEDN